MPRKLLFALCALALVLGLWIALRLANRRPEWTTDSPAALAALQRGLEAERKFYRQEALGHYLKARALDPRFAAAQVMLLRSLPRDDPRRRELREELEAVDRSQLTRREAFLVDYWLAFDADERERAGELLRSYLERFPDDPHALYQHAGHLWDARRYDEAEEVYTRLLAVDPNWVTAQNNLGYLAMGQGRFAQAEDRFRTYRYVAPDQANPHDSLGELMVLQGRWQEAERELEESLRIRPDFCASYYNLVHIAIFTRDFAAGRRALQRAREQGGCAGEEVERHACRLDLWERLVAGQLAQLAAGYEGSCTYRTLTSPWVPHLAALRVGDLEQAKRIESHVAEQIAELPRYARVDRSSVLHLEGARLVTEGKPAEAAQRFAEVDGELDYFGAPVGTFKLYNRLMWAHALTLAGDGARAKQLLAEVAAVNAQFAAAYREGRVVLPQPLAGGGPPAAATTIPEDRPLPAAPTPTGRTAT
jgi:tetratricopeptide (TPR) repeat protein